MTKTLTQYLKYTCMALLAALIISGVPGQGYAAFSLTTETSTSDFEALSNILNPNAIMLAGVCSDSKGVECDEAGDVQKCETKRGVKLCQECGKWDHCPKDKEGNRVNCWGSGKVGDCWDKTVTAISDDTVVLDHF